jgi:monovalent cation/hydrogen antiporter
MGHYDWLYGSGSTFPLVFTTAVVIVATLVVQGTALGPLVRILGVSKDAERDQEALEEQQFFGKEQAARAALDRLSSLQNEGAVSPDLAQRLGQVYKDRLAQAQSDTGSEQTGKKKDTEIHAQQLGAEGARILQLREERRISDYALGFLERRLDLGETLLD